VPRRDAFFLGTAAARRFCLVTAPDGPQVRGAILHVHGFAEELNLARRTTAQAARELAQDGWLVLQMDLQGCGDSAGDFADASWSGWMDDLDRGLAWLRERSPGPVLAWSMRAGSLLAADWMIRRGALLPHLAWQPVASGKQYLTQFLRIRLAGDLASSPDAKSVLAQMRADLQAGRPVLVAGYMAPPALTQGLEAAELAALAGRSGQLRVLEMVSEAPLLPSPANQMLLERLAQGGLQCSLQAVQAPKFWQIYGAPVAQALVTETVRAAAALAGAGAIGPPSREGLPA
jgi:exosortase A-associated hydrolase 2